MQCTEVRERQNGVTERLELADVKDLWALATGWPQLVPFRELQGARSNDSALLFHLGHDLLELVARPHRVRWPV